MSAPIDNGGPAFPFAGQDGHVYNDQGMSLSDYFAAKAMQALIAKTPVEHAIGGTSMVKSIATGAYDYADAMLARSKS